MTDSTIEESFWTSKGNFMFECPGCNMGHVVYVGTAAANGSKWSFNGNKEKPTFTPSLLVTWTLRGDNKICHSFIRDGRIQFLNDCTHSLKGQTVDLPKTALIQ